MTQFVPNSYPDFDTDAAGMRVAFRDAGGSHHGLVTYQTSQGGGNRLLVGDQELIQVAVVRQGIGSDLPSRPDAEIVHWYASDRVAPDADHPHDQVFPAGPLLLFARNQQGASHDAGNPSAVSNASGVGVLGGAISAMLDQSPRTNDAAGSGAARSTSSMARL